MRNISRQICTENENTHFVSKAFFRKPYRVRDNVKIVVERGRPQMTIYYGACNLHAG